MKRLKLPVKKRGELIIFSAGEEILLEGILYTARDKVHSMIYRKEAVWPFELKNNGIYYCGPTSVKQGFPMGSCGPTTSARMDPFTPELYKDGLAVTVGKGPRNKTIKQAIKENRGLYLVAFGGCGALYGSSILKAEIIGFDDLGPQAVYRIEVRDFPVIVGIDTEGRTIFHGT